MSQGNSIQCTRSRRRRSLWAFAACLILLLAPHSACSKGQTKKEATLDADPAITGSEKRVASQTILSDEILWALGTEVRDRVVAISPLADDPRYSSAPGRWPAAISRLSGSSEALLALRPQVVIIASFTAPESRAFLETQEIEIVHLDGFSGFKDLWRHTRTIAGSVGAEAAGERLIMAQQAELAAIAETLDDPPWPAALAWSDGFVAGAGTSFDDIASYAGFDNLAAERGLSGHVALSLEDLVAWDPAVIVIPCDPPNCADTEAELATRPGIAATRAAREKGILGIPAAHLSSTGAGMLTATKLLRQRQIARKGRG